MAYQVYLGALLIPAPGKITTKIKNQNKTLTLISEGEINQLKDAGLTDFEIEYVTEKGASLVGLSDLKKAKEPFYLKIIRPGIFRTEKKVSLEEYRIKEQDKHITDQVVSIKLKQYRPYGTKELKVIDDTSASVEEPRPAPTSPAPKSEPKTYTIKSGDTLWAIAKRYYGDGSRYKELASANGISNPNLIITGNTLTIPV